MTPIPMPEVELRIHKAIVEHAAREQKRDYLGISEIGEPCERRLWAKVNDLPRSASSEFSPRLRMIFSLGDCIEEEVIRLLAMAGYEVHYTDPDTGEQFEATDFDGRLKGHLDGKIWINREVRDPSVLEIKSANEKSFEEFIELGYERWNPKYWGQIHGLMGWFGIDTALAVVYSKNTSRIHSEFIRFDHSYFELLVGRAIRVLSCDAPEIPAEATSASCTFCKWCPYNEWCWGPLPKVNFAA